jgi:hypothetical protein
MYAAMRMMEIINPTVTRKAVLSNSVQVWEYRKHSGSLTLKRHQCRAPNKIHVEMIELDALQYKKLGSTPFGFLRLLRFFAAQLRQILTAQRLQQLGRRSQFGL